MIRFTHRNNTLNKCILILNLFYFDSLSSQMDRKVFIAHKKTGTNLMLKSNILQLTFVLCGQKIEVSSQEQYSKVSSYELVVSGAGAFRPRKGLRRYLYKYKTIIIAIAVTKDLFLRTDKQVTSQYYVIFCQRPTLRNSPTNYEVHNSAKSQVGQVL